MNASFEVVCACARARACACSCSAWHGYFTGPPGWSGLRVLGYRSDGKCCHDMPRCTLAICIYQCFLWTCANGVYPTVSECRAGRAACGMYRCTLYITRIGINQYTLHSEIKDLGCIMRHAHSFLHLRIG